MNDKDFCFFSLLSIITILYFVEAYNCLIPKGFIPMWRLTIRLGRLGLNCFQTDGPCHILFFSTQVNFQLDKLQ